MAKKADRARRGASPKSHGDIRERHGDSAGPHGDPDAKGDTAAVREHWKEEPDEHDYPAAADYLSLLLPDAQVTPVVTALRKAPIVHRLAKDLLRASRLETLGEENPHVASDLAKVRRGERLSPVLVVRGSLADDVAMTIADGYHRICASYHLDENADIPCRLVDASVRVGRSATATRSAHAATSDRAHRPPAT